jgi:hypothetical protein
MLRYFKDNIDKMIILLSCYVAKYFMLYSSKFTGLKTHYWPNRNTNHCFLGIL